MSVFVNSFNVKEWESSERNKMLSLFLEHEYGFCPIMNEKVDYKIITEFTNENLVMKKVELSYKNHRMYFGLYLPKNSELPLKTFLTIVHPYAERNGDFFEDYLSIESFCPINSIIENGFAVALLSAKTVAEDNAYGTRTGIFNVCERAV